MTWTEPTLWNEDDPITAVKLNQQVRDNLLHLYRRPYAQAIVRNGEFLVPNTATLVEVDPAYRLTFNCETGRFLLAFSLFARNTTSIAGNVLHFDVQITNTSTSTSFWASSGTSTPAANNLYVYPAPSFLVGTIASIYYEQLFVVTPTVYSFRLFARANQPWRLSAGENSPDVFTIMES